MTRTLGDRLKRHRLRVAKLSIEDLHQRSQVSVGVISQLENNKENITVGTLRKLLAAMNIKEGTFRI